jgi:TonB family protein
LEKPALNVPPERTRDELRMPGAGVGAGIGLVVLSKDDGLIDTLERVVTSDHAITLCISEDELAKQILAGRGGVAVVDAAASAESLSALTQRLRQQFPDLVLVVAGSAQHQGELAAQIASGEVYRFLHKPVSEQRVRLFVEAAMRRHDEEHAVQPAPARRPAEPTFGSTGAAGRRWLLPAALIAAAAIAAFWLLGRDDTAAADSGRAVATATPADPEMSQWLEQADAALESGALLAPADSSAAALYQRVLAQDAGNARARSGIDRVVNAVLTSAEQAMLDGQLDAASRSIEAARTLQPDNVRIAFLTAQLGKERERALLTRARAAAASGDVGGALAALAGATPGDTSDPALSETRRALQRQQVDERLKELLDDAALRLQRGALLEPASDNARFFLESARTLAPRDVRLNRLTQQLRTRLLGEARQSATRGDAAGVERWLRAAQETGADPAELTAVRTQFAASQNAARGNEATRLAALVTQRIGEGRLTEPANDSAKHWLAELQRIEPGSAVTTGARQSLLRTMIADGRAAVGRGDAAAAGRLLTEAEALGASTTELGGLSSEITALRERQRAETAFVGISTLKRTRFVEPDYPRIARDAGTEGWVDMEFVVRADGSVADVRVLAAQPTGTFDAAAIAALSRWRFEPVQRDGRAVDQRARMRMRFTVQ